MARGSKEARREDKNVIQETVQVYCRLRPLLPSDLVAATKKVSNNGSCIVSWKDSEGEVVYQRRDGTEEKQEGLGGNGSAMTFNVTGVLDQSFAQHKVYERVGKNVVESVVEGYNGTIFAYGQTGSGKTYTMMGENGWLDETRGIIPRALEQLLTMKEKRKGFQVSISLSYIQIYCEIIQDLIEPEKNNVCIREDRSGKIFLEGVAKRKVGNLEDCKSIIQVAMKNRVVSSTKLNAHSSRSHAALIVYVEQRPFQGDGTPSKDQLLESSLVLVDLAGSERAKHSGATYTQFEELKAINLSLSALGNCVSAIAQGREHIPYRDSKLTRLLQQSLGGNAKTSLVVTVNPDADFSGETLSTLYFAQRARSIKVQARINQSVSYFLLHPWIPDVHVVQIDYEELYNALLRTVDSKEEATSRLEIANASLKRSLKDTQKDVDSKTLQLLDLQREMTTLKEEHASNLKLAQAAATRGSSDHIVEVIESVNKEWRDKLSTLEREFKKERSNLLQASEEKEKKLREALAKALQDEHNAEYELRREREEHLETLRVYKSCHVDAKENKHQNERRIGEMITELDGSKREVERLEALVQDTSSRLKEASEKLIETQKKLLLVEKQRDVRNREVNQNYVSREQLSKMEAVFSDTIQLLNRRVGQLEALTEKKRGHGGSSMTSHDHSSRVPRASLGTESSMGSGHSGRGDYPAGDRTTESIDTRTDAILTRLEGKNPSKAVPKVRSAWKTPPRNHRHSSGNRSTPPQPTRKMNHSRTTQSTRVSSHSSSGNLTTIASRMQHDLSVKRMSKATSTRQRYGFK